jgi:tRNA (adenine22-N1)-methyltransferase
MNSSKVERPLSARLNLLASYHTNEPIIWDIGCDHGLLGSSFLGHPDVEEIHLVDSSGRVVQNLKDAYITTPKINILNKRGQELIIRNTKKTCIFIAGMGGLEVGRIIQSLSPQLGPDSRFVISPHRKILELRKFLGTFPISLLTETLIEENNQFYQILVLGNFAGRKISPFGEELWDSPLGERYRRKTLLHFEHHKDELSLQYLNWLKRP